MYKKFFDKTGREIKAGMSIYFDFGTSGTCIPVKMHEGRLCFDNGSYVPLDEVDLSNGVIEYDPEGGMIIG